MHGRALHGVVAEADSVVEGPALFPFPSPCPTSHRLGLAAFIPKVWDLSSDTLERESAKCWLPSFRVGKSFIGAPLLSCSPLCATLSRGSRAIPVCRVWVLEHGWPGLQFQLCQQFTLWSWASVFPI